MATPTYELIETTTLTSSASSVTFSSITQDYRDLVLVMSGTSTSTSSMRIRFNSDTGTNYYAVRMQGDGSSASSGSFTLDAGLIAGFALSTTEEMIKTQILDYSATDKHKSWLANASQSLGVTATAGRWADTTAINNISFLSTTNDFASGSSFSLYGIAS